MLLAKAAQKKNSPKGRPTKKHGGSPIEKTRTSWNPALEKILVELLHEHNTPEYRGQNGWTSEARNKIVKEFHEKDRYVCLTKSQIQEKEKELKREYRMLKEARKQSGASWNNQRCIIEAEPAIWNNIIISFPKAKKFRTKSFPLFEALGELYDGYTAEGTYNFTSTEPLQHPIITQVESDQDDLGNTEIIFLDYEDTLAYQVQDDVDATEDDNANAERLKEMPHRRVVAVPRNKEEKEPKRQKKSVGVEGLMERYLDMRTKQTEDEAAQLAREKEAHLAREKEAQLAREKEAHLAREKESNDFSIKRCISVLNSMDVTKAEKVKAYTVFKNSENREIFAEKRLLNQGEKKTLVAVQRQLRVQNTEYIHTVVDSNLPYVHWPEKIAAN
uniref:Myb/SANT-like domain-containing protein n=1 Tax=Oryza sativa subsp. japonica TaxID=39947 RepID=Q69UD8_ORYSJ|nr:hypothetical protein [Oryza sativa Japonica Group]BAD33131.1 hypothetical protein [Oryza sativa Japonica Group]